MSANWTRVDQTDNLPSPRYGHSCTVVDASSSWGTDLAVLYGGQSAPNALVHDDLYVFNPQYNTWVQPQLTGEVPERRSFHAAAADGPMMYVFGGSSKLDTSGRSSICFNDLWAFDLNGPRWSKVDAADAPAKRKGANLINIGGGRLLLYGGKAEDGSFFSDIWIFVIPLKKWHGVQPVGRKPPPRALAAAHCVDTHGQRQLVVYGGNNGASAAAALGDVWCLTGLDGNAAALWSPLSPRAAPSVTARVGHASMRVSAHEVLFAFGQWEQITLIPYARKPVTHDDALLLDVSTLTWRQLARSDAMAAWPTPSTFATLARFSDGAALLFGGMSHTNVALNDTWLLQIDTQPPPTAVYQPPAVAPASQASPQSSPSLAVVTPDALLDFNEVEAPAESCDLAGFVEQLQQQRLEALRGYAQDTAKVVPQLKMLRLMVGLSQGGARQCSGAQQHSAAAVQKQLHALARSLQSQRVSESSIASVDAVGSTAHDDDVTMARRHLCSSHPGDLTMAQVRLMLEDFQLQSTTVVCKDIRKHGWSVLTDVAALRVASSFALLASDALTMACVGKLQSAYAQLMRGNDAASSLSASLPVTAGDGASDLLAFNSVG